MPLLVRQMRGKTCLDDEQGTESTETEISNSETVIEVI